MQFSFAIFIAGEVNSAMKKSHIREESYVFQYILSELFLQRTIDIYKLADDFGYHRTSLYRIMNKIIDNWAVMNYPYTIQRLSSSEYRIAPEDYS